MMNEARIEVLETAIKLKDEEITKLKKKLNVLYEHLSEIGNEIARLKKDNENAMDLLNDYVRREYGAWKGEIPGIMATYKKNSPPQPNAPFSLKNLLGVFDDGKGEKCDSCRFGPRVKGKHVDSCGNFKMADQCYLFGYGGFTPKKDSPPQPENWNILKEFVHSLKVLHACCCAQDVYDEIERLEKDSPPNTQNSRITGRGCNHEPTVADGEYPKTSIATITNGSSGSGSMWDGKGEPEKPSFLWFNSKNDVLETPEEAEKRLREGEKQ